MKMNTTIQARLTNFLARHLRIFICLMLLTCVISQNFLNAQTKQGSAEHDTDGDGLTDFQEKHKYFTDPSKRDSDGDGIPDGHWLERREYQYTIRSVVQVMRPVTIKYLNDDYQDARILDETDQYVELEVIHYPFNTVASAIRADKDWRKAAAKMNQWVQPGPSSDWTPEFQRQLKSELKQDGIDIEKLDDRQIVEQVSKWLCDRAKYKPGCTSFVTQWDQKGKPMIADEFMATVRRKLKEQGLTLKQQWDREVSATGMFRNKVRGSCTSSAIYLNGCMKATGIPTRTILCIPIIDASDAREFELLQNISQDGVRQHLLKSLKPLKQSWASHTFNEVYVGGRWWRLNYSRLGQGIYDRQLFGLITHVATFNDWADAKFHQTVGRRQKTNMPRDVFGFRNPYSTISLRDQVGVHSQVELPKAGEGRLVVERVFWTDDNGLHKAIRDNCRKRGRFGFIAYVSGITDGDEFKSFLDRCDRRVTLKPKDDRHPTINITFDTGCLWLNNSTAYIYVQFDQESKKKLVRDVEYQFVPNDQTASKGWKLNSKISVVRKEDFSK